MYRDKKILAFIPARSGSKGLEGKNIKLLKGKPLIAWTIEQARASDYINNIIVSTDDEKIAFISKENGAQIPFLRPKYLAKDNTPIIEVVIHFLEQTKKNSGKNPDFIVMLQPTSPLRSVEDINLSLEILLSSDLADAIVSMTKVRENPYWMKEVDKKGYIRNFLKVKDVPHRRQDLKDLYELNGAIYICKTDVLIKERTFLPKRTIPYLMPKERAIDIDDIVDFNMAELLVSKQIK